MDLKRVKFHTNLETYYLLKQVIKQMRNIKNLLSKLGFDILETERVKSNVREKQAIERCKLLYEKGKLKNEINKLKYLKNNEIRDKNIIKDCTFKPRTNSAKKLISGNTASSYLNTNENKETITSVKNGSNINNTKNNNLKTNSNFNFARKLNRNNGLIIKKKKLSELPTFKPNIKYNKHIDKVFNPEKNIVNDYSTRIFMTRYNNARKQSTEKKTQLAPRTNSVESKLRYPLSRCISTDNTLICVNEKDNLKSTIKNLHHALHSIDYDN